MYRFAFPLAAALAAVITPAAALAQDTAPTFVGPRAEATVGWTQLGFDLAQVGTAGRDHSSDVGYGGAIGYDAALTPTLIGGVDLAVSGSGNSYAVGDATTGSVLRQRRQIDATARLGTRIGPNALLYAKAGYSNLQVRNSTTIAGMTTDALSNLDGYLVGAGGELALTPKTYVKAEYRYTNYGRNYEGNSVLTGVGVRF